MMAPGNITVGHQNSSMGAVKSISQINTYAESNKNRLYMGLDGRSDEQHGDIVFGLQIANLHARF
jgi:hypothetical protein